VSNNQCHWGVTCSLLTLLLLPLFTLASTPPTFHHTALSEAITADKPLGVDILGTRVTLFRDEAGQVVCVDDTCPHRWVGPGFTSRGQGHL
jgi:hypothetical protein